MPFTRPESPFSLLDDRDTASVRLSPAAEQSRLVQQRIFVYRQDVEIRTQQRYTARATHEESGQWLVEGHFTWEAMENRAKGLARDGLAPPG